MTSTEFDLDQAMQDAFGLHNAGRLEEARFAYLRVLEAVSDCADAQHGLAILHFQTGRHEEGLNWARHAADTAPEVWRYRLTHGLLAGAAGHQAEAATAFGHACALRPDCIEAWTGLAEARYALGRFHEALEAYRRAYALNAEDINIINNMASVLDEVNQHEEAIRLLRRALEVQPDFAALHNNLGKALNNLRRYAEALEVLARGLTLSPDAQALWYNLGNALAGQGQVADAVDAYREALRLSPDDYRVLLNLGNALRTVREDTEAVACYRRAIELAPDVPDAYNNLAMAMLSQGDVDAAREMVSRALALAPNLAPAHNNLGQILKDSGEIDEAVSAFRQAVALAPKDEQAHSNLVYSLSFHPGHDDRTIGQESRSWARAHAESVPVRTHAAGGEPGRRLRIGYVSPDFRDHCQALFMAPLLANHDSEQVEVHCYADVAVPDGVTERLKGNVDAWRPVYGVGDARVADMIGDDRIDVLVDLTMHMSHGRPLLFARKPAPVQMAWLAYPGTTGQSAIDYRVTDPWLDPPGRGDDLFAELPLRLPDTFWCYDPLDDAVRVGGLPADEAGHITFGCLNNFCKVNEGVLRLWAAVMRAVPESRLLLMAPVGRPRDRVRRLLEAAGVVPERVQFVDFRPRRRYLETYRRIDLCLDTLPYNGHTTSLDAYWMGVPVVTRVGNTVAGRAGWSQLNNLRLADLAAFDDEQFVATACALAADRPRLRELRTTLRERMRRSPLMDGRRFAAALERLYRQAWREHCR